jgi:hypothetical protein
MGAYIAIIVPRGTVKIVLEEARIQFPTIAGTSCREKVHEIEVHSLHDEEHRIAFLR